MPKLTDPTRSLPREVPTTGPLWRDAAIWFGRLAVGFLPWVAYRTVAHAQALLRWQTAGECVECHENLTWRIGAPRPGACPACGRLDPCPEPPPGTD